MDVTEHYGVITRLSDQMHRAETSALVWNPALDELVDRARNGDKDAFTEIYRTTYPSVAKYVYYKTGRIADHEDVVNEIYLAAWRSLPRYRGGYFPGWLFRIARNISVGEIRRRSAASVRVDISEAESLDSGVRVHEIAERELNRTHLVRALSSLNDQQREVIVLKFLLGMSNAEVAGVLGKSENSVNAQQHRALRSMEKALKAQGVFDV